MILRVEPPPGRHDRRTQVDRQETDAGGHGPTDAAVIGPGRRVDADRQRIDIAVADDAAASVGAAVAEVGDREQQREVGRRRDDDHPRVDHRDRAIHASSAMTSAHAPNRYAQSAGTPATTVSTSNTASRGKLNSASPNSPTATRRAVFNRSFTAAPPSRHRVRCEPQSGDLLDGVQRPHGGAQRRPLVGRQPVGEHPVVRGQLLVRLLDLVAQPQVGEEAVGVDQVPGGGRAQCAGGRGGL